MELFERLKEAALRQNLSGELPSWIMADVVAIAERPERYATKSHLVERLVSEIAEYDPYAGAGCFGGAVTAASIEATLREIVS